LFITKNRGAKFYLFAGIQEREEKEVRICASEFSRCPFSSVGKKTFLGEIKDWMGDFTGIECAWEMFGIEFYS
jgi:hypothetical protein